MDEYSFILKVRMFAHTDVGEVLDTIIKQLEASGLAHWEFEEYKPEQQEKRIVERKKKDIPENRTYV
jgi:hypothetical protein